MKKELGLYELVLMLKYNSSESEVKEKIDTYKTFLTDKGSQVMVKNHGKRSLSYLIEGFDTASYFQMVFLGNGLLVKQLHQEIQRDTFILRAITTKLGEKILD